jgi:hypothetical protein
MNPWIIGLGIAMVAAGASKGVSGMVDTSIFGRIFDWSRQAAFTAALPSVLRPYAQYFLSAGRAYSIDPWMLAGICYRESLGGTRLTPPGPGGTGDFTPRGPTSRYFQYANPNTGLPNDGQGGWGRGLMQLDYGAENAWVTTHDWRDPQVSLNRAAEILAGRYAYFVSSPSSGVQVDCWRITTGMPQIGVSPWQSKYPGTYPTCTNGKTVPLQDPRPLADVRLHEAVLASYNAGAAGVLQALAMGLPAEAVTAGQDYVSFLAARIATWNQKF